MYKKYIIFLFAVVFFNLILYIVYILGSQFYYIFTNPMVNNAPKISFYCALTSAGSEGQ